LNPDFGLTAEDYARHRVGFPPAFFDRLRALGVDIAGRDLVDLGTGTGALARAFAAEGARVVGIDRSEAMLGQARRLAREAGLVMDFRCATAEATGLGRASADVVTAGQCWHWFDGEAAARECARILTPGGTLVIASFDWLPLPGSVPEATEDLIAAFNPTWTLGGGVGLNPACLRDMDAAGFVSIETFSFDVASIYSREDWCGRIRASAGVGASLPPERVAAFDAAHAALLRERFPGDPLAVPHRVFAAVGRPGGDETARAALRS
jgi:SAM-dependent methyltransferase